MCLWILACSACFVYAFCFCVVRCSFHFGSFSFCFHCLATTNLIKNFKRSFWRTTKYWVVHIQRSGLCWRVHWLKCYHHYLILVFFHPQTQILCDDILSLEISLSYLVIFSLSFGIIRLSVIHCNWIVDSTLKHLIPFSLEFKFVAIQFSGENIQRIESLTYRIDNNNKLTIKWVYDRNICNE